MIARPFGNSVATAVAVAIVFHSGCGHTARQAEAVRRGIEKVPGASVLFLTSEEAQTRREAHGRADAIMPLSPRSGDVSAILFADVERPI